MTRDAWRLATSAMSLLALLGAACGGSEGEEGGRVAVALREFRITANPAESPPGASRSK